MYEYEFSEHIMGTTLTIAIVTEEEAVAAELFRHALERFRAYESQFSRFIPESELSLLNRERSIVVSPLFVSLLHIAKELYRKTDGHFNPLLQIERFGYTEDYESIKDSVQTQNTLPYNTNFAMVEIDDEAHRVTLVDDQKIDFGGFLKGYLAEVESLRIFHSPYTIRGVIVNVGGDLYTYGRDAHDNVFVFEVENPITGMGVAVPLHNCGLATSGTYRHAWDVDGGRMHHILGKEGTKNPRSEVVSASVVHAKGATSEAYAKTLLTVPPELLESMIKEELQYIIIYSNGTIKSSL